MPASIEGESVADCYDQASLEEFASSKDPAMANDVEKPSASMNTGGSGRVQRTEAKSELRDYVPMKLDKAHVTDSDLSLNQTGDRSREKGGTQKFLGSSLNASAKK
jgi:hypothetical protein